MPSISDYFCDAEVQKITKIETYKNHPLAPFLKFNHTSTFNDFNCIYENTLDGMRLASVHDSKWFSKIKEILLNDAYENTSSALSELRAYGCLKRAFFDFTMEPISKGKKSSPDFSIEYNAEKLFIEVYCKNINGEMLDKIKEYEIQDFTNSKNITITPFGIPKKNENITENVIHSLAQAKEKETQANYDFYSILWVDIQDNSIRQLIRPPSALPIRSWNGHYNSGELWYSCYGNKGLPILEGEDCFNYTLMRHDGRFNESGSKYDAIVFSLPKATIQFENPHSKKKLSNNLRYWVFKIPWFKLEYSWLKFPNNDLIERINLEKKRIRSFCNFIRRRNGARHQN